MLNLVKRVALTGVFGWAVLVPTVSTAFGQNPYFQVRPGLTLQQAAFNVAVMGQALQNVPPYALGYNPYRGGGGLAGAATLANNSNPYLNAYAAAYSSPYMGANYAASMYGNPYYPYYDPYGSALYGASQVIKSQGSFMVSQQQAYLMREQLHSEKLNTRRKRVDEYLYERDRLPTMEDERQRTMKEQLERSRNNPPVTEILSGKALNDLLADLRKNLSRKDVVSLRTFPMPLDEAALKHINMTKGIGSIALVKNDGRLHWPIALSTPDFKEARDRMDSLTNDALRQAGSGNAVDGGTLRQMTNDADRLRKDLRRTGGNLTPSMYIDASIFLNNLDDAVKALQQPDVGNYVNGKYVPRAKTVPELVKFMAERGLQFAAAVPGDEAAYVALHQALAAYDRSQVQVAER
jgi:hypothetical protein